MATKRLVTRVWRFTLPGDLFKTLPEYLEYAIYYCKEELAKDHILGNVSWVATKTSGGIGQRAISFSVIRYPLVRIDNHGLNTAR